MVAVARIQKVGGGEVLEVVRRVSGKEWKIGKEGCRRGKRLGLPVEVGHGANS